MTVGEVVEQFLKLPQDIKVVDFNGFTVGAIKYFEGDEDVRIYFEN